jgi:serine acetyltransferase
MLDRSALTGTLTRFLNSEGIEHCVIGCEEPDCTQLVVARAALQRLATLLRMFCDRHGLALVHHARLPDGVERYGLAGPQRTFWMVDVRADFTSAGCLIFTAGDLLRDRVPSAMSGRDAGEVPRAAPASEFLCHLLGCIERGVIGERDRAHLSALWQREPRGAAQQIERFWNAEREGGVILRAASAGNWQAVSASMGALSAVLRARNQPRVPALLRRMVTGLEGWCRPAGLLIACAGPLDCCTDELIEALCRSPVLPLRETHTAHLPAGAVRPPWMEATDDARAGRARMAQALQRLTYLLAYCVHIRPRLVRAALVVLEDRVEDFVEDAQRRIRHTRSSARPLTWWLARPQLWLVVAPAPKARTRHPQRSLGAAQGARRDHGRRLRHCRDNVVVLDGGQPIQQLVSQAESAIQAELARRTARRLHLASAAPGGPAAARLLLFASRHRTPLLGALVRLVFNSDIRGHVPADIRLPRPYGIVIHAKAAIGRRVTVMQQVTIGPKDGGEEAAPVIADDVFIGAGAKILGGVRVGRGAVIAANAVVTRDVLPGVTVAGVNRIVTPAPGARSLQIGESSEAHSRGSIARTARTHAR